MGKVKKAFDWAAAKSSHYLLRLAYVGTRYHGVAWQQPEVATTVESELFSALVRTCLIEAREKCNFSRCGRTDRGVHAYGNYIALTLRELPGGPAEYVRMLNRVLPTDIRILAAAPVPADFDARFRCTGRIYKYYFAADGYDVERMRRAAHSFLGEHDFRNFCKADVEATSTFVRTVREVSFEVQGQCVCVTIIGNAFLWHQIRCIMAILFLVGQGLEDESIVTQLLDVDSISAKPIYELASEDGLVLFNASYPDLVLEPDPEALKAFRAAHADAVRRVAVLACLAGPPLEPSSQGKPPSHRKLLSRPREPTIEERLRKHGRFVEERVNGEDAAAPEKADAAVVEGVVAAPALAVGDVGGADDSRR